jgi:hypothetical protein
MIWPLVTVIAITLIFVLVLVLGRMALSTLDSEVKIGVQWEINKIGKGKIELARKSGSRSATSSG